MDYGKDNIKEGLHGNKGMRIFKNPHSVNGCHVVRENAHDSVDEDVMVAHACP